MVVQFGENMWKSVTMSTWGRAGVCCCAYIGAVEQSDEKIPEFVE